MGGADLNFAHAERYRVRCAFLWQAVCILCLLQLASTVSHGSPEDKHES